MDLTSRVDYFTSQHRTIQHAVAFGRFALLSEDDKKAYVLSMTQSATGPMDNHVRTSGKQVKYRVESKIVRVLVLEYMLKCPQLSDVAADGADMPLVNREELITRIFKHVSGDGDSEVLEVTIQEPSDFGLVADLLGTHLSQK